MSTITDTTISTLNSLIETLRDGENGFRDAAEHVKSADLKALFVEFSQQRHGLVPPLQTLVTALGGTAENDGSVSATVHRGWIDLKAALTSGDDHAVLAECERGEDIAVSAYQKALDDDLPDNVAAVVRQQYVTIKATHDRVKALRDQTK